MSEPRRRSGILCDDVEALAALVPDGAPVIVNKGEGADMPFATLRGLIGTDLAAHNPDRVLIDNPFQPGDRVMGRRAITPDVALIHAELADSEGNIRIGRQRDILLAAHAAKTVLVTVERVVEGSFIDDEVRAAGVVPSFHITALAEARAAPCRRARRAWTLTRCAPMPPPRAIPARCAPGWPSGSSPLRGPRNGRGRRDRAARGNPRRRHRRAVRGRGGHVAVGMASPLPAAGALLARECSGGRMQVSILGHPGASRWTTSGSGLFDLAGTGGIDGVFLSGGQIDGHANTNLVGVGDCPRTRGRWSGSFGSAHLYFVVPRVILFRWEHSRRTLVEAVDFIGAPGVSDPGVHRTGGPIALITYLCLFDFDRARARFSLRAAHPGHALDEVRDNTGFDFDLPAEVPMTTEPDAATPARLRGPVATCVAGIYPLFAREVFGLAAGGAP
ncbi:MAG: hypothetical protein Kow0013_00680 [Pararhodobacter sp.]